MLSLQFASFSEEFVNVPANVVLKCTRCKLSSRRALVSSFTQFSRLLTKAWVVSRFSEESLSSIPTRGYILYRAMCKRCNSDG